MEKNIKSGNIESEKKRFFIKVDSIRASIIYYIKA